MKRRLVTLVLTAVAWDGNAQLQNLDFETWDNPIVEEHGMNRPTGWWWGSGVLTEPQRNFIYPPETPAQSNNYALKLSVWYTYVKDIAIQSAYINTRPESLTGYYKYTDNVLTDGLEFVTDTAQVSVYLTKWDLFLGQADTIGSGVINLNAAADYTQFVVPINYYSDEMPDTVKVILDPSMVKRYEDSPYFAPDMGYSSYFTVDNLVLNEASLATDDLQANTIKIFPNPVKDAVNITGFSGEVSVFDVSGKKMATGNNRLPGIMLPLAHLSSGIYYLQLNDGAKTEWRKIVKK